MGRTTVPDGEIIDEPIEIIEAVEPTPVQSSESPPISVQPQEKHMNARWLLRLCHNSLLVNLYQE